MLHLLSGVISISCPIVPELLIRSQSLDFLQRSSAFYLSMAVYIRVQDVVVNQSKCALLIGLLAYDNLIEGLDTLCNAQWLDDSYGTKVLLNVPLKNSSSWSTYSKSTPISDFPDTMVSFDRCNYTLYANSNVGFRHVWQLTLGAPEKTVRIVSTVKELILNNSVCHRILEDFFERFASDFSHTTWRSFGKYS